MTPKNERLSLSQVATRLTELLDFSVTESAIRKTIHRYPVPYGREDGAMFVTEDTLGQLGEFVLQTKRYGDKREEPSAEYIKRMTEKFRQETPRLPVGIRDDWSTPKIIRF